MPNSILGRTDRSAPPTDALQTAERHSIELHAMGVLLQSSYSASETALKDEGSSDKT